MSHPLLKKTNRVIALKEENAVLRAALERLVRDAMVESGVVENGKFTGRWERVLPSSKHFRTDLLGKAFDHAVEALRKVGSDLVKEETR